MKRPLHDHQSGRATVWVVVMIFVGGTAVFAWSRVGLFDLPRVPNSISVEAAGLTDLTKLDELDRLLDVYEPVKMEEQLWLHSLPSERSGEADTLVHFGVVLIKTGSVETGLNYMRDGIQKTPTNVAMANAYRMIAFRLRRDFLSEARQRGDLTPKFPPHLDRQPIAFFEELVREHPSREAKLQLALAWVDEMLLFPALEIKAPSSVEAVKILTDIIDHGNAYYVPALFARGLNHLHRPARLVWPEADKTPPDAAARDIGLCVAIGRKVGGGSPRLQATLAMTLGDAYVKAGRLSVARSWWQIAQNLCHDEAIQQAVRRRFGWSDEEILDRLEEELDRARTELDHPMTDLALMWN